MRLFFFLNAISICLLSCDRPDGNDEDLVPVFDWKRINIEGSHNFIGADFIDSSTGYIVDNYDPITDIYGTLYKTTDGGKSWTQIPRTSTTNQDGHVIIGAIQASGKDEIFGLRDSFYKSINEGRDWSVLCTDLIGGWGAILLLGHNEIIVTMGGKVYKSYDEGINFVKVHDDVARMQFVDTTLGYGVGTGHFSKTTDGGDHWVDLVTPIFDNARAAVASYIYPILSFPDDQTGFVFYTWIAADPIKVLDSGVELYKTTDGGTSWELVDEGFVENAIINSGLFNDENNGFFSTPEGVYQTKDGGKSWSKLALDLKANEVITKLHRMPSGKIIALGRGDVGFIFRQED